ncbi:MAG: MBL fold metallo-hydrolase [Candidatus Hodarchaeales archaeon]
MIQRLALLYGANSVIPEDTFTINNFNVRCFYMYTMPVSGQSSHPKSSNYTSYIIEVDDFTIFHAGDSGNIDEYEQLTCEIDLALLPLGPGCQTMTGIDVVSAIETIEPSYFIPIHFTEDGKGLFISQYIEYFDSYKFS